MCAPLRRVAGLGVLALVGWTATAGTLPAADRTADLVTAMRERGWDDTAVEFLGWFEKSTLATDDFRKELPFHRAQSLASQSRQANRADQKRLLAQAAEEFQKFAKASADSPLALESLRQSANLSAELGISEINEAKALPEQATTQRGGLLRSARTNLEAAAAAAELVIAACDKQLDALPKPTAIQADAAAKARRDDLRNKHAEARFLLAIFTFERARTHEPKSKEFTDAIDAASKRFSELNEEYRDTLVGATSRFYQGRCAQERGDFEKALGCYADLLRQPTANADFRRWTARAQRHRTECLMAMGSVDDAIEGAQDWLAASRPAERQQPEWLEVAFRMAAAKGMKIKSLPPGDAKSKKLQAEIRSTLREVSEHTNEFQNEARVTLAALGQRGKKAAGADGVEGGEFKNFEDAFAAGKAALEVMGSSAGAAKLAQQNNPEAVEELEEQAATSQAEALRALETAVELADRQTSIDELNSARYFLCWLYWQDQRAFDTALLGEYLAKGYPDAEYAKGAANFALAALEKLTNEARTADATAVGHSFEAKKLAEVAELIATRWPDSPEGTVAVNILIGNALRDDRIAEAEELLARLPEGSRAGAQLNLGSGLWTQYLRSTAGRNETPSEAAVERRDKAGALLVAGFEGLRKDTPPTFQSATGALYLVQYLLARGDAAGALKVLEAPAVGPLRLVEAKLDAANRPEFVQETYKAALRTYLSTEPPNREEAKAMMTALEKSVAKAGGDEAAQQLTKIYVSLGLQLQRQVKGLTAAGENKKAQQVAAAFDDVLQRVAARPDAGAWAIRSWIAQTNLQIGQGLEGEEAKPYLDRAKQGFEDILQTVEKDKNYAPNEMALLGVKMRLGDCLLAMGDYAGGIEQYAAILLKKPNALDWQLSAAVALQQWGVEAKDPEVLSRAIRGDKPQKNGQNLIWGWLRLASMADMAKRQASQRAEADAAVDAESQQRIARYEDLFFEARYNVAKSRFMAAMFTPKESRMPQLEAAERNIESMKTLYPGLGGAKWKPEFDALLKKINEEIGKQ